MIYINVTRVNIYLILIKHEIVYQSEHNSTTIVNMIIA